MKNIPEGVMKYEDILKDICNVEDLHHLRGREWEGCLGACMLLAFLEGVHSSARSLAKHLGMSSYNNHFSAAYDRLKVNGVFGPRYGATEDPFLKGEATESPNPKFITPQHMSEIAWCNIAGVAGGFTGIRE